MVISWHRGRRRLLPVAALAAVLLLITRGGHFDFSTRNHESSTVVYASLVTSRPAQAH